MSKSNICSSKPRFGFDQTFVDPVRVWQGELKYLKPNIRIFEVDYPIRQMYFQSSWWPIIFLIFSHKLDFSHSDWSVRFKVQQVQGSPLTLMTRLTKNDFFFNRRFRHEVHRNHGQSICFFMLLIALKHTMILKSTKSWKSHTKSTFSLRRHRPRHQPPKNVPWHSKTGLSSF